MHLYVQLAISFPQANATVAGSAALMCVFSVCETEHMEEGVRWSPFHLSDPSAASTSSPHTGGLFPGSSCCLCPLGGQCFQGGGLHDLSLKMTVARMRKKVFQPSVTAKPRHTIIRVRPHPEGQIYVNTLIFRYRRQQALGVNVIVVKGYSLSECQNPKTVC